MADQPPKLPESPEGTRQEIRANLVFSVPEHMSGRYAHQMVVQTMESEVILSFFEVIPPLLLGTPEQQKELIEHGIKAECVARIIVPKNRLPDFVKAMSDVQVKLDLPPSKGE
jgi:hypothetical protein